MSYAAPLAMAAATLFSAYSSIQQGKASQDIGNYNQAVMGQEAVAAESEAAYDAKLKREAGIRAVATMRAQEAKSGFVQLGTPSWVQEETASEYEKDAAAILAQGMTKASTLRSKGNIYGMQGAAAARGGSLSATGTLLQGAANIYGRG